MKKFLIGQCEIKVNKQLLESFLEDIYFKHYKKERLKHLSKNDKRLPYIKITSDIFSVQTYFKDDSGKEHRIFLDGKIFLDTITITDITLENTSLNSLEYRAMVIFLKNLTKISDGYILASINNLPGRFKGGEFENYKFLLKEMFSSIPNEEKDYFENTYKWFIECSR